MPSWISIAEHILKPALRNGSSKVQPRQGGDHLFQTRFANMCSAHTLWCAEIRSKPEFRDGAGQAGPTDHTTRNYELLKRMNE